MTPPILALTGATNATIQAFLSASARRWRSAGRHVVGVTEVPDVDLSGYRLVDLATGARYRIYQSLGPGSEACKLCASGIADACEDVRRQILAGCDVVVLSKFGKLETTRGGLVAAFSLAVSEGIPILTAVSPAFQGAWQAFSGDLSAFAGPDEEVVESWLSEMDHPSAATATTRIGSPGPRHSRGG